MITTIFILLVLYQLKHFNADYPLQNQYMLGKFKDRGWFWPLACHALVHAWMNFIITIWFVGPATAWCLATFDGCIHFIMDRIKASPKLMGRWKAMSAYEYQLAQINISNSIMNPDNFEYEGIRAKKQIEANRYFWWALGFDQMIHHLTHYSIIWYVVTHL